MASGLNKGNLWMSSKCLIKMLVCLVALGNLDFL